MDLLGAYRQLDYPNITLNVVGDGELRQSLEDYTTENGLTPVHFRGFQNRNEIPNLYVTADLLVLSSQRDTWGIVLSEALCYALPVIASNQVGAVSDLVNDGENGLAFHAGDIQALIARIQHIIELPEDKRLLMGAKSRERIMRWVARDLVKSIDQYLDFINRDVANSNE